MTFEDLSISLTQIRRTALQSAQAVNVFIDGLDRLPHAPMVAGNKLPEPPPSRSQLLGVTATYMMVATVAVLNAFMRSACVANLKPKTVQPIDDSWFNFETTYMIMSVHPAELSSYPAVKRLFDAKKLLDEATVNFSWALNDIIAMIDAAFEFAKEFDETVRELNRQK